MGDGQNKRRRIKKRTTKKRTIYAIILSVMLFCFAMIVFLLLFQVRKIEVSGNRYLTNQEIADWLEEDELSTNSLYLMIKYHFMDYEMLPAMEKVEVSMKSPWAVKVTVQERQNVGYIMIGEKAVYFDKDGIVLAQTGEWWDDVPCIEGLDVENVELFEELPVSKENKKVFEHLLDMSQTLNKYELQPDRIVCSGASLQLYFGNKCAILGDENLGDRIAQIPPILEKLGDQKGTLHLEHYDENNTSISFIKDVLPDGK